MDLLRLKDVWKSFGTGEARVEALRGITLRIQRGEFVVLSGPSGSGKTTLLNVMSGLDRPDRGTVVFEGQPLHTLTEDQLSELRLRRVGFVFQAHNLIPVLTARENAELLLLLQGVPEAQRRARVDALFQLLGLEGLQNRKPSEMSGGQQQRVAVIRAIAHRPSILFLDEPTANLDTTTSRVLMDHLAELNLREKVTFVFSTHDPLVLEYAHRVLYIRDGQIQKDELRKGPSCPV